ncbi:MAG: RdgB/HAM1 family non-canonical purine NTP pyrophosphatase [Coprobacillus sp.]|nr:RdgB/HAM1 family non-canonical purine NTP pyrophosphatase [Coprobacillus sp.]
MNYEIILATNNKGKVKEVRDVLAPHGIIVYGLSDLNLDIDFIEGDGSYLENAAIKAKEVSKYTSYPILADDSGLEIEALDNRPGVHSSRYMKECGSNIKAMEQILSDLEGSKNRKAKFICTMCLYNVEDKPLYFTGEIEGEIAGEIHNGENGFGYDPIFLVKEKGMTFSELSEEEKNKISHRARALTKVLTYLRINGLISK